MIQLQNVQKVVDGHTILEIEGLELARGEVAGVVGPPGNGKRALFDLLIGRANPTAGRVAIDGLDVTEHRDVATGMGVLFAEDGLYLSRTALANLRFFARLRGIEKQRVSEVVNQIGLRDHQQERAGALPPGLRRRLALGVALIHRPSAIVLMEPFARCDERSVHQIAKLIRAQAAEGKTCLILAGSSNYLEDLCDVIYQLTRGRLGSGYRPGQQMDDAAAFKIPVRLEGRVVLVNPSDILFAEAEEGRATLQTVTERLPTQYTLRELEERLSRGGFFRAHRGYLVNLQHVAEVIPFTRSSFSLRLDDEIGTQIPLSKDAARELKSLFRY